jgi:proline iminopeptidase
VHGGPGSNISPAHRRFFDPQRYNILLFDQRGCGKSTPSSEIAENTTWHLVDDIRMLLDHRGIAKTVLFGGSWGSTLSMAFATSHPDRVVGMILRGIFLVTERELRWLYQDGASHVFREEFEKYRSVIPESERGDLLAAFHRLIHEGSETERLVAARAWCRWEAAASFLVPRDDYAKKFDDDRLTIAFAAIETHYFAHRGFFAHPDDLIDRLGLIRHVPGVILQGRYDMVCPMETAWRVHQAWPEAQWTVVPKAGHSAFDDEMTQALIDATDAFADRFCN